MRTIQSNDKKHTIELYDSVDEMLEVRYHKFNQMMVLAAGVGNTITDIIGKLGAIRQLIDDERPAAAKVELTNLYQSFFFVQDSIDPCSTAFATLVKSIDGVEYNDMTDSGLELVSRKVSEFLTIGERNETINSVKKKIEEELNRYFPNRSDENLESLTLMKGLLLTQLDGIIEDKDVSEKIESLSKRIRSLSEPTDYSDYEVESDKAREKSYLGIQETLHRDAKGMTILEYETACEMLRDRAKEYEKTRSKQK